MNGIVRLMAAALPLIFLMAIFAGCSQQTAQPPASPPANQPPAGTPPAMQPVSTPPASTEPPATTLPETPTASISIKNFAFNPAELTVAKGTKVTWTNEDTAQHQIQSDKFSGPLMRNGDKFEITFTETGSFEYTCAIHPSMKGKIIVQ
jgi:plastocyanin